MTKPQTPTDGDALVACRNCANEGWVCENHRDRPWLHTSSHEDACGCGAGAPCGACNLAMASASYSEPWRELALRAIGMVESAVRETSWGQPTFGPDADEELPIEYNALFARNSAARQDAPEADRLTSPTAQGEG